MVMFSSSPASDATSLQDMQELCCPLESLEVLVELADLTVESFRKSECIVAGDGSATGVGRLSRIHKQASSTNSSSYGAGSDVSRYLSFPIV